MKVYKFGVKPMPDKVPEFAFRQLILQNRFWNELVALDKKYQEKYKEVQLQADQRLQEIEVSIIELNANKEEVRQSLKDKRKESRKDMQDVEAKSKIQNINAQLNVLREERRGLRQKIKNKIKPLVDSLNTEKYLEIKNLRQQFAAQGLYWGNYNAVLDSFKSACKRMMQSRSQGKPFDLNFHRFDGTGRLKVQIQGGITPAALFSKGSGQLQIDPVSEEAWSHPSRGNRKMLRKTQGRMRVCSDGRNPVWIEFPVTVHRRLPDDALIKEAELVRKKVGRGWRWSLNLSVQEATREVQVLPVNEMAIDLGWRKTEDCIRVAYYYGPGGEGLLSLDESFIRTNERLVGLQSVIDQKFNEVKELVISWKKNGQLPEGMLEELESLSNWRSPGRMLRFIDRLSDSRFDGDTDLYRALTGWKSKHLHLYDWQSNLRDKMHARRKEQFRVFAKWVSKNFSRIYLEDFDLRDTARRKKPEDGVDSDNKARHWSKVASPGEMRSELERACAKTGAEVVRVPAEYTTVTCPLCSRLVYTDAKRSICLHCEYCGYTYDQDQGAAENIFHRGSRKRHPEPAPIAG